jgi:hypothetical protein
MSPAQRIQGMLLALLARLFRPLEGNAWLTTAGVAFFLIVGLTSYHLWHQYGPSILAQPQYRLTPDRLHVTPQPSWIHSDVKQSAVTAGRLHQASLLDKELVLQVKQAFNVQPWVKRVLLVNKRYPAGVEIELEYRRPVAMVEVPAGTFPAYNYEGLLPVDEEGYLLPVEIGQEEAQQFPKIGGIDSSPAGPPGNPWGDPRVAEATLIVTLLEELWHPLKLAKVQVPPRPTPVDSAAPEDFVLVTQGGRHYTWGSPPGRERPGEEKGRDKAAGLKAFLEQHGPLDAWEDQQATSVSELISHRKPLH